MDMTQNPFASIIIPTYNQADYLKEALDSLLAQTDGDWEAVVVNDGSTDHTQEIAESYAAKDSRIRTFHQANGGVAEALNTGLRNARGDWIHWLSSDDLFEPNKLAINRTWIERHPESNFFFSYFTLLRQSTGERERRELWGPLPKPEHQIITLFYRNYISGISICLKRSAWEAVGHFDVGLRYAQDYDQWLRLLQQYKARFIPEWTVISRNHAAQGSETFPDACYFDTAKAAIRFLNRHPFAELVPWVDLSDPAQAEAAVKEALDVACERTSFIYCMGVHPGLIGRVLEWVFADGSRPAAITRLVRDRVSEMSFLEGEDDWCWMWRQIALSLLRDEPQFSYDSIDPTALGVRQWRSMAIEADAKHETMRAYLTRFDKIDPQDVLPDALDRSRVAFLISSDAQDIDAVTAAAGRLKNYGLRPTILVEDPARTIPSLRWIDGVAIISVEAFGRETLPWLGNVELAVAASATKQIWLGSLKQLTIGTTGGPGRVEELVLATLRPDAQRSVVVFLERILWGGGAERVVYDLARHLDRKRYLPMVFTMFEEHVAGPQWPRHITHEKLSVRVPSQATAVSVVYRNRSPISLLLRLYRAWLPLRLRERLRLASRLKSLARRMLPSKGSESLVKSETAYPGDGSEENPTVSKQVDAIEFDFVAAMQHHNPSAVAFARAMSSLEKNTLVVSAMEEAAVVTYLAKTTVPLTHIATLHSLESECLSDIFPQLPRYKAEKRLLSAACNEASAVTMPTEGCCVDLGANFNVSASKLLKIWNPIDCARIAHFAQQRLEPAERWAKENPGFRIVCVGRIDPQKDPDLLLDACVLLRKKGRAFSLAFVGDGWYRPKLQKRITELRLANNVVITGAQANPFPWIASSDALALSSRFEAFALVLAEAMACGTPVVSVNCPTGPAEVLANGAHGLLIDRSAEGLAEGLERLMDNEELRQSMRKQGIQRAEMFDIKNVMPEWDDLIQTVSAAANS